MTAVLRIVLLTLALAVAFDAHATPTDDLFKAASIDDLRDARRLLSDGVVDRAAVDARGDTLLIVAIRNDAAKVVDYLLADPATDLEATDAANETALMIAAFRDRPDIVGKLLARGAQVNRVGWTALHYAASVDARPIVAALLDRSAYIDAASPNRTTPLMMAARGGFDALCRQLIDAGADPTLINERDLTAADFARRANAPALADWLAAQAVAWRAKYGPMPSRSIPDQPTTTR
jgi:ankyrin repeat protein